MALKQGVDDILGMLTDPDIAIARTNLERISRSLNMSVAQVPRLLERYGDVYLSLSCCQHVLDRNTEALDAFLEDLERPQKQGTHLRRQYGLRETGSAIKNGLLGIVAKRPPGFGRSASCEPAALDRAALNGHSHGYSFGLASKDVRSLVTPVSSVRPEWTTY